MTPRSAVRTVDHRDPDEVARMEAPRRGLKRWAALMAAREALRDASDALLDLHDEESIKLRTDLALMSLRLTARIGEQETEHGRA